MKNEKNMSASVLTIHESKGLLSVDGFLGRRCRSVVHDIGGSEPSAFHPTSKTD